MDTIKSQQVTFKVFRFNEETDYLPYYNTYTLDVTHEEVVLDILNRIKWDHDGSLSYRRSCRHGICGVCSIKVNGKGILACKSRLFDLVEVFGNEITIEPLSTKRAIKDLIIDKKDFWDNHAAIKPYLVSEIEEHPAQEHLVSPHDAEKLLEADYCIQCGACHYSCPALEVNDSFFGPAAFAAAYRFSADVRDEASVDRLHIVNEEAQGVWDCVKCMECAEVCPKEVNPIEKITKLHNMVFEAGIAKNNVATRHAVGFAHSIEKHGLLDEGELVRYSEGNIGVLKHVPVALKMFAKGKIVLPWNMPKADKLDEIKKLIKSSSTVKF
ncbi:succinate dehydrogenase subunit B [Sulfuricurvum kujiense DSM 16994]|uniref:Fumarate reductase iron-sulfur subunit n=1 Tax=Sulfuricurvum kujiense (strain ATCC BAA-921 / DSM 16994 / JCM 11577 / YK-1) TaxID=709032 RepID=E4U050_SULKY|nr:succinate dehydrogenase iron-sulfur subunit [Sulfuricurvum kujiense]ADR34236.1 succinate dehydrogenase subunit B [Sulfuricurvum kujiense DSM 16994]